MGILDNFESYLEKQDEMSENQEPIFKEVRGTDNVILNWIGNLCGRISHIFLQPHIKWGTMFEWDLKEDIDKEDY
jgi:hypothetical protein